MNGGLYITRLCAWAPGVENSIEWNEWAQGKRDISSGDKGSGTQVPAISFTDSLFRRRLSQISKMTVQVVHGILPVKDDTKMLFVSFRGELSRQYQINKMLIEEKSLMPAAFSLSVFNAPPALASIALGLKGGYSALYPGNNSFDEAFAMGLASAESALYGAQGELIFIYADEQAQTEYGSFFNECPVPVAFAFLLTREHQSTCVPLSSLKSEDGGQYGSKYGSPLDFLKRLILCGEIHVSS
ncbi:MAG: beta-ketoacyl synthase chain length factor [Treponema sp.]|nr:beta-ketoacyl synthase chain length factor [Treponema sp.]